MLAKLAYPNYKWGKMHYYIQEQLFKMLSGGLPKKRIILETPPQHFKSTLISQIFLSWLLITDPTQKLILLSYDSELAEHHSKVAREIVSEFGYPLTHTKVSDTSKSKSDWHTTKQGYLKATSIMSGVTGRASSGLIIDDPIKGAEDAASPTMRQKVFDQFSSTAETRLHPDGFIIIVNTRWHPDDLCGRLLEHEPEKWTRISLPAIAHQFDSLGRSEGEPLLPERYSLEWYKERQTQFNDRGQAHMWAALYDCNPTGDSSCIEWVDYLKDHIWLTPDMMPDNYRMRVLALDPSKSKHDDVGDYSAFTDVTLDHENHLYVRSYLQRCPADQVIAIAVNLLKQNRYDAFIVETNMMQSLFADAILNECKIQNINCPLMHHQSKENKVVRIRMAINNLLAQKRLHFLTDSPSNKLLVNQLRVFPTGQHDDGPDSLQLATVAINHLLQGKKNYKPIVYKA